MNTPDLRLPPHSIEAEQSVIGALLIDGRAWDRVVDTVSDDDFYRDDHRRIFGHIRRLAESGKTVDVVTVWESIERSNECDQVGGLPFLGEIASNVPSAANVRHHAGIVAEHALRRKLLAASSDIAELAFTQGPARESIDEAHGILQPLADCGRSASEPRQLSEVLGMTIDRIQEAFDRGGKLMGLQTGYADLDQRIRGLRAGDMVVIAGRPGMGKTTLGLNIAENVALNGGSAMVFSLEMGDVQLATRSLSRIASIELDRLRDGNLQDEHFDRITVALGKLHNTQMAIDETAALSIAQIHARARRQKRKVGHLDLIVIDYLGLIRAPASKTANSRNDEITMVSAGIKALAKDIGCPVIALSQLSRKVEERADKRPVMSDLRDSGSIEQDADLVLLMYRDEYYNANSHEKGIAEVNVAKHRNGEPGVVRLGFQGQFCRFHDLDHATIAAAVARSIESPSKIKRKGGFKED